MTSTEPMTSDHSSSSGPQARLTGRQEAILRFVRNAIQVRGYAPSLREIGDAVGLASGSAVAHQLVNLQEKGLIVRDPRRPRALRVLAPLPGPQPPPQLSQAASPLPTGDLQTTVPVVLKVMLTDGMAHALTSGASLTVERLLLPESHCIASGDADVLGQVIAISHPVNSAPE